MKSEVQTDQNWLEPALKEHLRPVEAPRDLWRRVQSKPRRASRPNYRLVWVAAAAVLIVGVAIALRPRNNSLESESAQEIRAWVKQHTDLNVPFPARLASSVRLAGAHRIKDGIQINYAVGGRPERLQISKISSATPSGHRFIEHSSKVVSWTMGGQLYTIECAAPEDAKTACVLCHAGGGIL